MLNKINVYQAEIDAGIADLVRANACIAYHSQLMAVDEETPLAKHLHKSIAAVQDIDSGLFYLEDVLVTTGRNKNRDVFTKEEVWNARYSSEDKPFNFNHKELEIIGHIIAARAVDENFKVIADDTPIDQIPDKFHIINGSVIYKQWDNEDRRELINKTIAEIKNGEWYVSMECVLRGFDYELTDPDGISHAIARTKDTAFLTKHLKQYGGDGVYRFEKDGPEYTLGRILKQVSFSGKGLVKKPANPESVIFIDAIPVNLKESTIASLGYNQSVEVLVNNTQETKENLNIQESVMPDTNVDVSVLQSKIDELTKECETLKAQVKENDVKAFKGEIETLKASVSDKDTDIANLNTQLDAAKSTVTELTARAEKAEKERDEFKKMLDDKDEDDKKEKRKAKMEEKGATKEKAEELVKTFANLNDEQFDSIVEVMAAGWKTTATKPEEVIQNAKAEQEPTLNAPATETEKDAGVKVLAGVFESFLNTSKNKKKNK